MIGNQTRWAPSSFRLALVFTFLLLLGGFAQAQTTIRQALESALMARRMAADAAPDPVYDFYAQREFRPAWSGGRDAEEAGALVARTLAQSDTQGLRPADYAATASRWDAPPASGALAAAYDISLTEDLLRYAHDVRLGRVDPSRVYADVALPSRQFDAGPALNKALADRNLGSFLAELPPPHVQYRSLVTALARYRALEAAGGWPQLPTKALKPQLLMARLALEDSALAGESAPSDEELRQAVMRFQVRNGLAGDGRIGPGTLTALNVPVNARIEQIIANMERWRWLPRQFEARTVRVNVPDQLVAYYRNDEALLTSRVAVGRLGSKTPIARMMGLSLIANPPWEVPDDIARDQILPKLRSNPHYLADNNMVLINGPADDPQGLSIDWRQIKAFPYDIDQKPGKNSAMGVLMLDSPNDFGVYLHDTPGKDVFKSTVREKSNGCVRVQEMAALSALVFSDGEGTQSESVDQAVASGETQRLMLSKPVPVYLLYWTAIADDDGVVGFRSDFYGRDKPLVAALSENHSNF